MIGSSALLAAIDAIASVEGATMSASALVQDVVSVARAFPDPAEFEAAVANTARAIELVVSGRVAPSELGDDYKGWRAYRYQHRVAQGEKADMRVLFREEGGRILVRGFGHRREPADFYWRMAAADRGNPPASS